jgi:APA family basic amino acid/polyamine antiporter
MPWRALFRVKPISEAREAAEATGSNLRRVLGPGHLVLLGIGAIVGAGIFAQVGTAAAGDDARLGAGPALIVSFALTAGVCGLCALCYAELASLEPMSGSAYTYAYSTLGELIAWIIGWDLILEYAVGNIAVAVSWSGYFCNLTAGLGWEIPKWLATDFHTGVKDPQLLASAPQLAGIPIIVNLPAVGIVVALTALLVIGIRESAWFNALMVGVKLAVLAFFVGVGCCYVRPEYWHPFAPNGWEGIQTGAAVVFFAYIGFDAVSTTAEECRNPRRDLPIGILGSLVACTLIYVIVAAVLIGMVPLAELRTAEPLTKALQLLGLDQAAGIVAFGSVVAHTAVLLVFQLGQPRILMAMARDGLLPPVFQRTHPRFRTPHVATLLTGAFVAVGAAFANFEETADLCSIGTLSAFLIVCIGVLVLRWRDPDRPRPFRTPWVPWVPMAGAAACFYLASGLPAVAWTRFVYWLLIGLAVYGLYGFQRSRLRVGAS